MSLIQLKVPKALQKNDRLQADKASLAVRTKAISQEHAVELCTGFAAKLTTDSAGAQGSQYGNGNLRQCQVW